MNPYQNQQQPNTNKSSGIQNNSVSEELPDVQKIREQFSEIANTSDPLTREYKFSLLENEAQKLGISSENYRRLFETYLQNKIHIPQYPQKWWLLTAWISWLIKFPKKRKVGTTILLTLLEKGVLISLIVSLVSYYQEAPKRKQQAHYQAWEIINGAKDQSGSGGRIEALQELNKDGVSLRYVILNNADLSGISLNNAFLIDANFQNSKLTCITRDNGKEECTKILNTNLSYSNLQGAELYNADFQKSNFFKAKMQGAKLRDTKLKGADFEKAELQGANFPGADLEGANFKGAIICGDVFDKSTESKKITCANFMGAKSLTATQIKSAKNWQNACYDLRLRKELNLPGDNPPECYKK
ncbi:pentapeptide repeat-containing protein [Anabaena sp. FACHB-1237]|uniref:pentapeptide repeat-containing protein n=1 Tax=Anabaena sp. FACHB-1237 TaxID=2692769 RepID=UPI001680E4A5|nr:pentapeptide repeat-containing protein [Anabaena sp. FACHB-1237]MBD2136926.1 pentapeptide repeat-containing protein [Anabaena sp. FACHB-1237]